MRRLGFAVIIIAAFVLAGFAALIGSADKNGPKKAQIRVELQDGL